MNGYTYPVKDEELPQAAQLKKLREYFLKIGWENSAAAVDNALDVIRREIEQREFENEVRAAEDDYNDLKATEEAARF